MKKPVLLIFLLLTPLMLCIAPSRVKATEGTLGNEFIGSYNYLVSGSTYEKVFGSQFTMSGDGVALRISVALRRASAGNNLAHCAIYDFSDESLIAETECKYVYITTTQTFYDFAFSETVNLEDGETYLLACWVDYTTAFIYSAYNSGGSNSEHSRSDLSFDTSFPNPFGIVTSTSRRLSIHCDYAPIRHVSFYFNYGGQFRVNNGTVTNGTTSDYQDGATLELVAVPMNRSFIFLNFTWDGSYNDSNPYAPLTVTTDLTVWCYFADPPPEKLGLGPNTPVLFVGFFVVLLVLAIPLVYALSKRRR